MTADSTSHELSKGEIYFRKLEKAAAFLSKRVPHQPTLAVTLDFGFDELALILEDRVVVSGSEVPHLPPSTAHGHRGALVFGRLHGKSVLAFEGRTHTYEGYGASEVAFGALVANMLGCKTFVFTTAAGSLNPAFRPGHIMVCTNHISLFSPDPAEGLQYPGLGPTSYDQTDPYSEDLAVKVIDHGRSVGASMQRGTLVYVRGPRYESRADIQVLHGLGADAVAMSIVPEVLALKRAGAERIIGLASITNMAAGLSTARITEDEVLSQQARVKPQMREILTKIIAEEA